MVMRESANLKEEIFFKFDYVYAISIVCLLWRAIELIQYDNEIGPLVKIVEKMSRDFKNFFILYILLSLMFSIVGSVNYVFYLPSYKGMYKSFLTVVEASIGNYHLEDFDSLES